MAVLREITKENRLWEPKSEESGQKQSIYGDKKATTEREQEDSELLSPESNMQEEGNAIENEKPIPGVAGSTIRGFY